MTPVHSLRTMDCFKCCVATVLDLPYMGVPDFFCGSQHGDRASEAQEQFIRQWFALRELVLLPFPVEAASVNEILRTMQLRHPGVHYILGGQNNRGRNHAVVCKEDVIVHDPNGNGLTNPYEDGTFQVYMVGKLL